MNAPTGRARSRGARFIHQLSAALHELESALELKSAGRGMCRDLAPDPADLVVTYRVPGGPGYGCCHWDRA